MESKKGLYVGCGLTYAPESFKENVASVKETLRERNYDVLEFTGEQIATPSEVYIQDIQNCVKTCEVMLAIVDYPSLGLGWEMAVANTLKTPTLAIAQVNTTVSRLVLGAAEIIPSFYFQRYEVFQDIPDQLDYFLKDSNKLSATSRNITAVEAT
ncbi:MAG: hypothetical protein OXF30_00665 [Candidatus Saccharibacteria bacterium]|nr:hypothetical protein [Candidatus Saccharibacteria bacterium]